MFRFLTVTFLLIVSSVAITAQNYSFGYPSPYNNALYTRNIRCYQSVEAAMKAPADSIIALKVNANTKNMLAIKEFKNLKYLFLDEGFIAGGFYLSNQALESFFTLCDQMPQLEYLSINDAKLMSFVKHPERLRGLEIAKCDYNSMQETFPRFNKLEILIVSDKLVKLLPDVIGKLESLNQLELYTESLPVLPDVGGLQNLLVLRAQVGKITKLHPSFALLKQAKDVSITGMVNFKIFPAEVCGMEKVEELQLELRNAVAIPDDIGKLTELRDLYLNDCNKISALPKTFSNLSELEYLYISGDRNSMDVSPLLTMKNNIILKLVRCDYVAIAKQLQNAGNLKMLMVPTDILPSELKKVEQYIPSDKIQKQDL